MTADDQRCHRNNLAALVCQMPTLERRWYTCGPERLPSLWWWQRTAPGWTSTIWWGRVWTLVWCSPAQVSYNYNHWFSYQYMVKNTSFHTNNLKKKHPRVCLSISVDKGVWFPQTEHIRQTKSCSETLDFLSVSWWLWVKRATSQIHHLPDGRCELLTLRFLHPCWQKLVRTWDWWPVCSDSSCRVKVMLNTAECPPGTPGSVNNMLLSTYTVWHLNTLLFLLLVITAILWKKQKRDIFSPELKPS